MLPNPTSFAANFAKGSLCQACGSSGKGHSLSWVEVSGFLSSAPLPLPWILDVTELKSDFTSIGGIKKQKQKQKQKKP